jgi:hypothetical protein
MDGLLWREEAPLYCRGVRFLAAAVAVLTLLTSLPYLAGHRLEDSASAFLDTLIFEHDFNAYCAFVRQSAAGAWLFHNPFTPELHRPVFLNLEFLVTGKAAALLDLEAGQALQLQRGFAGIVFAGALWGLGRRLIAAPSMRRLALVAVLSGGGFGWMSALPRLGPSVQSFEPVDLYAGVHPFFWLLLHPHFAAAEAVVVLALWAFVEGERTGRGLFHGLAGILAAIVGLMRPYDMLFLQATSVLYAVVAAARERKVDWRSLSRRLLCAAVALPVLAYSFWLFRFDPVFMWWGRQGVNAPPPVASLLAGLGLLPLFLAGALLAARRRDWTAPQTLLACAAAASLLLTYSYPWLRFSFQFVTTLVVPSLLLAFARLEASFTRALVRRELLALALAVAVNAPTSIALWCEKMAIARAGGYRIARGDLAAFAWLDGHSRPRDVVLASERTSNRVPRFTHDDVVAGYSFSTVQFPRKLGEVEHFFRFRRDERYRRQILVQYGVRFLLYGPDERALGAYDPKRSAFLTEVFRGGEMTVYEVRP